MLDDDDALLQLSEDDVQEELDYWQNAVYGFIIGANPPWQMIENFLKRIWSKHNIDKISFLPNEVFLARFQTQEMKEAVLGSGHFLFNNKPVVIRPWTPEAQLIKEELKSVPAWIRLENLPLKFWGKSLPKIASLVGSFVKCDDATEQKTRLGFGRVMVELKLGQAFPNVIKFLDEKQQVMEVKVVYEWKPCVCTKCKRIGHEKENLPASKKSEKQVGQTSVAAVQVQKNDNVLGEVTPVSNQVQATGSPSPIRITKASKPGSTGPASSSYKEVLSGSSSPRVAMNLSETKIKPQNKNKTVLTVFREWCICTNSSMHKGGRIWVLWKPNTVNITFLEYNAQFIHMLVTDINSQQHFYCTMMYAFNEFAQRESLWLKLKSFARQIHEPWIVGGDFNCVTLAHERLGGTVTTAEAEPFQECIEDCDLSDMPATGAFYTWNNKQPPDTRIYSRLDRVFINQAWAAQLPDYFANFLYEGYFDHTPCLVDVAQVSHANTRPFKYYNMWSTAPGFRDCVLSIWQQDILGAKMYRVIRKLKLLKPQLKKLNKTIISDVENKTDLAQTELFDIQRKLIQSPDNADLVRQELQANQNFVWLLKAKMNFMRQKAKAHWLAVGDANSSYFHGVIKVRRCTNTVKQIRDHKGKLFTEEKGIQQAFLEYYQGLLGFRSTTSGIKPVIVKKGKTCTNTHTQLLMKPIS
ncbi:uncharacterized protein LOC141632200 [Silene latifolia]|uniref:uncharacterized protein LOC141632200 n=1 Tax=Silene latifolia TaxID=37657 RepID=UPI003D77538C